MSRQALVAGLLAAGTLVGLAAEGAAVQQTPKTYCLALGDSIAYGVQPDKVDRGLPPSGYRTGYVDVFAARLRPLSPKIRVVNYSCPGESTVTFVRGGCPWLAEGRKLHDPYSSSQQKVALAFLAAHRGQVGPITLTLFGNDVAPSRKPARATSPASKGARRGRSRNSPLGWPASCGVCARPRR